MTTGGLIVTLISLSMAVTGFVRNMLHLREEIARGLATDRTRFLANVRGSFGYLLFVCLGIAVVVAVAGGSQSMGVIFAMVVFFLAWIGFGLIWLIRLLPREGPPPAMIGSKFNWLDVVLAAVCGVALVYAGAV